jgi:hypothetical protein
MSISKEKNNGERYKVQVTLQRRTFYMGYYDTYDAAVAANDAAVEARNKGMMVLVNHHAKHSKSMIASRYLGTDSKPATATAPEANTNSITKERTEEQAKAHVLSVISRWQYVNMGQLKNHIKAAYLDLYSSDLDKLVSELVSEGTVFKQGNQYYIKK